MSIEKLNREIEEVAGQKAAALSELESLARQDLPIEDKRKIRESLQERYRELWNKLKSLYAKKWDIQTGKTKRVSKRIQVERIIKKLRSMLEQEPLSFLDIGMEIGKALVMIESVASKYQKPLSSKIVSIRDVSRELESIKGGKIS